MYRGGDVLEALHGSVPEWLLLLAALVTRLGDVATVVSIAIVASWLLTWRGTTAGLESPDVGPGTESAATRSHCAPAVWLVGVVIGGLAAMTALKYLFALPRPELVAATPSALPTALESTYVSTVTLGGYGFPSGHAVGATVVYGALALAIPLGTRRSRLAVAGVLALAVSLSRVVLAVHYPGDIVAGVALGVAYLVTVWWLLERSPANRTTTAFALALGLALVAIAVSGAAGRSVAYAALAAGGLAVWSFARPRRDRPSSARPAYHAESATVALGLLVALVVVGGGLQSVGPAAGLGALVVAPAVIRPRLSSPLRASSRVANAGPTGFRRPADSFRMTDDNRQLGVELGELGDELESAEYPMSEDELLERYGDGEIDMDGETETLEDVIGPLNEDEYRDYGEVEQAIMNMVGDEAIGRKNYSDRTPPAAGEDRQDEGAPDQDDQEGQESF